MTTNNAEPTNKTKGERTASRIMDAAEGLFATHGYDGTSLRQIATQAEIKQPGLYNHFSDKEALYQAVLFRALNPMTLALSKHIDEASTLKEYADLPTIITDILLEHPTMAVLFQRAMQGDSSSAGNLLVNTWLETLLQQGMTSLQALDGITSAKNERPTSRSRAALAINLIAMFNLTTGYFLSQRAFASVAQGDLLDPDNIARQKRLLHKVIRAMLIS
ncbi:MAG: helix-turn-helix domain containing protein [Halioglobus sp.]|nr:helix-turn-helix domain containing protein [Halioglobus sp.]